METIGSTLTQVLGWITDAVTEIFKLITDPGTEGAPGMLPFVVIGVGISLSLLGVRILRSFLYGI